jgi:NAD-dependent SIR2 family protein deacetylase
MVLIAMIDDATSAALDRAAAAIAGADALLITAGAGMGVDSGLPDFRGPEGFWNAYPPYRDLGLSFVDLARPRWFREDPALAWGFYGHRLQLYRATAPHEGFSRLKRWMEGKPFGGFVFTSNVDGHFQKSGFAPESVWEVHGTLHWMQCLRPCGAGLIPSCGAAIAIDGATFRAIEPFPACPSCGGPARPNVLMFGDGEWDERRSSEQEAAFLDWYVRAREKRLAIVELGAGRAVPTVRNFCERIGADSRGPLVRINLREPEVPAVRDVPIPLGAAQALREIDERLTALA